MRVDLLLKDQVDQKEEILSRIMLLTGWLENKAVNWYNHPNPNLGGMSPAGLVFIDKGHKVLQYIKGREEENAIQGD
jgi:hypothetical protein